MTKVRNLEKMPKRKVTIGEILTKDDVAEVIDWLTDIRADVDEVVVIVAKRDKGSYCWRTSMYESRLIYAMEAVKHTLLSGD